MSARKQIRPTDRHVGKRIRLRRLMMKMTQTELSRKLGLTGMAVSKYEKGEIRIGASRLQEISRILQVTPAFFFESTSSYVQSRIKAKEPRWPDCVTELLATPDGLALAKAFSDMKDARFRRRILGLVVEILQHLSVMRDPMSLPGPPLSAGHRHRERRPRATNR